MDNGAISTDGLTGASVGPNVADSIKDLSRQIHLVNDTIGTALSSQPSNARCSKCAETTTTLGEVQSQVQEAMERVEKMNLTLTMLQTHATLVQQSVNVLASHVGIDVSDTSNVRVSPPLTNSNRTSAQEEQQQTLSEVTQSRVMASQNQNMNSSHATAEDFLAQRRRQIEEKNAKIRNRGKALEQNPVQKDTSRSPGEKSFREMLEERKKNGSIQKPIETIDNTNQKCDTLEDLVKSCASFITGSHIEYTTWLREELQINTIADLAKVVEERPEILVAGNGSVGMWQKRKFCDAVITAAASTSNGGSLE